MPEEPYYVFAPWWMRWMATWADVFIVAIPVIGILAVVGVQTDGPNAPDWPSFVIVGALFLYWTVLESWKGWTVGKLIFGTRVLAENEGSVRTWQGAVRTVFKLFGIGPLSFFTLGFILFSKKSQRLGDMAARTIVVRNVTKRIEREYRQRYGDQTAVPFIPPAPGWHPDPTGRNEHRYWDGSKWTEHVSTNGVQTTDAP